MPAIRRKYGKVGLGGTFDKLHRGHIKLIEKALEMGDCVVIGLTTDRMLRKNPKPHEVAVYSYRKRELTAQLRKMDVLDRVQIVPIDDAYGPTLNDGGIEAILSSRETVDGVVEINRLRVERGLKPLDMIAINMILAQDCTPISTTRIRKNEIDREGRLLKSNE
ncbi:MAG: pantetheine-phosphate adenylyltransferase [Thermoproteota archaeon]|nr:pantetheine-phosphate adenylyltransferase [Thermoproteota archaeon]